MSRRQQLVKVGEDRALVEEQITRKIDVLNIEKTWLLMATLSISHKVVISTGSLVTAKSQLSTTVVAK